MMFDFTVGSPPSYWPRSPSHQCELSSSMASRSCTSSTMTTFLFMCLLCVLYPPIQNYHLGINDQIVALPLWHLLTASMALAETPTAGAADDLVKSSCSFTMPYVCSVGIGSHDSVEEYFHARLDILRYLMKCFNRGGKILAVQHGRVCVQASGALQATTKQNGQGSQSVSSHRGGRKSGMATSFCCVSKRWAPRGRPPGTLYCAGHAPGPAGRPKNVLELLGGPRRTGRYVYLDISPPELQTEKMCSPRKTRL